MLKLKQRPFQEADKDAMLALAQAFPDGTLHVEDLPYRLCSWAFDYPDNAGIWVNSRNEPIAWAVLQLPFWMIDYAYHPGAGTDMHSKILEWADCRARLSLGTPQERTAWFVAVFADQDNRRKDLEEAGFVAIPVSGTESWAKVFMSNLMTLADSNPPVGFTIRPLGGANEVAEYVALQRTVFESRNMTSEWRLRIMSHPAYNSCLDLVAVAPDGTLAAYCICWFDKQNRSGRVEPLGVLPEYRGIGLGKAILLECLHRLRLCGAERIYLETDTYRRAAVTLYESVGFRVIRDIVIYRKHYGGAL